MKACGVGFVFSIAMYFDPSLCILHGHVVHSVKMCMLYTFIAFSFFSSFIFSKPGMSRGGISGMEMGPDK